MFKKLTIFALILCALFLTGCKKDSDVSAKLPDLIKIGFIGPLTGNAAAYGQDVKAGISLYFKENPTIAGKPVEVIYEDGQCNGHDAASAAQKLINIDKVQVILGGQCSGETLAAAPIAEQNKVVLFSELSSSPDVTTAGDYIFRNYPSDAQVAKTMVDYVLDNHKKLALITEQTDYAQAYRQAIKSNLETAGRSDALLLDEAFAADNTDFRTLLTKVNKAGAKALLAIVQTPVTGGFVVKQAKELGLDIQIYSGDALPGKDFFDTAKDAAEGVKVVMVAEDPSRSGYAKLKEKVGETQASELFPAFGYDAAQIISEAIAKVGYNGTAIKDYLYQMPTFKGIACDVTFDENGDNNVAAGVKVARNGEFIMITE